MTLTESLYGALCLLHVLAVVYHRAPRKVRCFEIGVAGVYASLFGTHLTEASDLVIPFF